jgi:hypothetical protein
VGLALAKQVYGIRFKPQVYKQFKAIAKAEGYTVTGAFEAFMAGCIAVDRLVFFNPEQVDVEGEARVLVDWLGKGQLFYCSEQGEEVTIRGRLLCLLPKLSDKVLKSSVEAALKKSIAQKHTSP